MLKIPTLSQNLRHCYGSFNSNVVSPKTEWKIQHITQHVHITHVTHIMNIHVYVYMYVALKAKCNTLNIEDESLTL